MSRGVVYLAIGEAHLEEAERAAASVKGQMPDLPVAVFTDGERKAPVFDRLVRRKGLVYDRSANIRAMLESPFERTLSLDTDTYMCAPVPELFELLDRFDVAAVHAPNYLPRHRAGGAPSCFPQVNGGVMLLRRSPATEAFLQHWLGLYGQDQEAVRERLRAGEKGKQFARKQPSLRQALYESEVRLAILPPEYNYRFDTLQRATAEVKILHGTMSLAGKAAQAVNSYHGQRVTYPGGRGIVVKPGPIRRFLGKGLFR